MIKKRIVIILALILVFTVMPASSYAASLPEFKSVTVGSATVNSLKVSWKAPKQTKSIDKKPRKSIRGKSRKVKRTI